MESGFRFPWLLSNGEGGGRCEDMSILWNAGVKTPLTTRPALSLHACPQCLTVLDARTGQPLGGAHRTRIIDWHGVRVGLMGLVEREVGGWLGEGAAGAQGRPAKLSLASHSKLPQVHAATFFCPTRCLPCTFLPQWLLTIPSIEEKDIQFVDFCEEGRRLATELAEQVPPPLPVLFRACCCGSEVGVKA